MVENGEKEKKGENKKEVAGSKKKRGGKCEEKAKRKMCRSMRYGRGMPSFWWRTKSKKNAYNDSVVFFYPCLFCAIPLPLGQRCRTVPTHTFFTSSSTSPASLSRPPALPEGLSPTRGKDKIKKKRKE